MHETSGRLATGDVNEYGNRFNFLRRFFMRVRRSGWCPCNPYYLHPFKNSSICLEQWSAKSLFHKITALCVASRRFYIWSFLAVVWLRTLVTRNFILLLSNQFGFVTVNAASGFCNWLPDLTSLACPSKVVPWCVVYECTSTKDWVLLWILMAVNQCLFCCKIGSDIL